MLLKAIESTTFVPYIGEWQQGGTAFSSLNALSWWAVWHPGITMVLHVEGALIGARVAARGSPFVFRAIDPDERHPRAGKLPR